MIQNNSAGKVYILIQGVHLKCRLENDIFHNVFNVVHYGGQISPKGDDDTVNVEHIPHKNRYRSKNEAHTESEHEETNERERQEQMINIDACAGDENNSVKGYESKKKVDPHKKALGQGENVFRNIDLVYQTEISYDTAHGKVAGLAVVVEKGQPRQTVDQIVNAGRGEPEHL